MLQPTQRKGHTLTVNSSPRRQPNEILLELLERLAGATELADVNIAAGIARNELLGIDEK
jgi:hypothetical protein